MTDANDPFHAHIYYDASDRSVAEQLHSELRAKKAQATWSTFSS